MVSHRQSLCVTLCLGVLREKGSRKVAKKQSHTKSHKDDTFLDSRVSQQAYLLSALLLPDGDAWRRGEAKLGIRSGKILLRVG
jgi:hypothetical protein